jgi:hypothetical protein
MYKTVILLVKVNQSHYTPWRRRRERKYSSYSFLTLALDGVSGQRHAWPRFTPGERTPGTHYTGGWVGPRAGLDTEARGKILCLCRGKCCNLVNWKMMIWKVREQHACAWETRRARKSWTGRLQRKIPLGRLHVAGRIILKWMLEKQGVMVWARLK